jgi:GcrA cell cycle regulator
MTGVTAMPLDGNPGWTEDRVERCTSLWMQGYSASQVANALGWVTRSAVIGKVRRLGLCRYDQAPQSHGARIIFADRSPLSIPAPSRRTRARRSASPVSSQRLALSPVMGEPLHIALLDLRECHCRWPLDGPQGKVTSFCGRQKEDGLSYCGHHARIATRPSAPRQPGGFRLEARHA